MFIYTNTFRLTKRYNHHTTLVCSSPRNSWYLVVTPTNFFQFFVQILRGKIKPPRVPTRRRATPLDMHDEATVQTAVHASVATEKKIWKFYRNETHQKEMPAVGFFSVLASRAKRKKNGESHDRFLESHIMNSTKKTENIRSHEYLFSYTITVNGRNPKQPPGMCKKPVNNGISTTNLDWCRISPMNSITTKLLATVGHQPSHNGTRPSCCRATSSKRFTSSAEGLKVETNFQVVMPKVLFW